MRAPLLNQVLGMVAMMGGPAWASYSITDLGPATQLHPMSVNNSGDSVGFSFSSVLRAASYSGGVITDLHNIYFSGATRSSALAINDGGQTVGFFEQAPLYHHAYRYDPVTGLSDLGVLGGNYSVAYAINSGGDVVGASTINSSSTQHGFFYSGGTMTDIGTLSGGSQSLLRGINNNGDATGGSDNATKTHAIIYSGGVLQDIGTLGGDYAVGIDINDAGEVVGSSYLTGNTASHAFYFDGTTMIDLGSIVVGGNSNAVSINNNGEIVGYSNNSTYSTMIPFLYSGGVMQDLNSLLPAGSGWVLLEADSINEYGQIVGAGTLNGEPRAFLMSPGC